MGEYVLVADCGSTNVTVSAVDDLGRIAWTVSKPNGPVPQEGGAEGWLCWDVEQLWETVCGAIRQLTDHVRADDIVAVAVATWGADGGAVSRDGQLTYPVIAWECPRTEPVMRQMEERLGARWLFDLTGYQVIRFNTFFKIAWLRQNAPEALDRAHRWLMMPGLLNLKLCGQFSLDITSASTMMMLELPGWRWSPKLLEAAGVRESLFPELIYPGQVIGKLEPRAAEQTGLRRGIPVVAAGHDTQFAPVGSGAAPDEAVLSTGTWEIAMLRSPKPALGDVAFDGGVLTEADVAPGFYDPQLLMMGSGVLEWVRENFFNTFDDRVRAYEAMIREARRLKPGSGGVMMVPSFVPEAGPGRKWRTGGTLLGLGLTATRAHVYRAALEGLCFQLRSALEVLCAATGFRPARLRVVGGGSKNALWNQMRADVCRMPVVVTERKEATTVGAAMAGWVGVGRFGSIADAEKQMPADAEVVEPSPAADVYERLYERYCQIGPSLASFYAV